MKQAARILNASAYLTRFDAPSPANDAPAPSAKAPTVDAPEPTEPRPTILPDIESIARFEEPTPLFPSKPLPEEPIDADRLKAEFETKLEALLADEKARATRALEEARAAWIVDEGERLEKQIAQAFNEGLLEIRNEIARIVGPFVQKKIETQARDKLLQDVLTCVENNVRATIEISGAPDLIARLSAAATPFDIAIISTGSANSEISVQCDATRIETAISPILSAVLGGETGDHE